MSSTEPKCPIGIRFGFALGLLVTISVSISAGAMAFTVIPSLTNDEAQECVSPTIPALDAAQCAPTAPPVCAATEDRLIMRPHFLFRIPPTTDCVTRDTD